MVDAITSSLASVTQKTSLTQTQKTAGSSQVNDLVFHSSEETSTEKNAFAVVAEAGAQESGKSADAKFSKNAFDIFAAGSLSGQRQVRGLLSIQTLDALIRQQGDIRNLEASIPQEQTAESTVLDTATESENIDSGANKTSGTSNTVNDTGGTTDPGTTDPGTTDPGTTDPGTTDPARGNGKGGPKK